MKNAQRTDDRGYIASASLFSKHLLRRPCRNEISNTVKLRKVMLARDEDAREERASAAVLISALYFSYACLRLRTTSLVTDGI